MSKTVLFDLDGTLMDTEKDFTHILNAQLESHGLPAVSAAQVRNTVSSGARALIMLGFGIEESHAQFNDYLDELLKNYLERIGRSECVLFPGIANLLGALDARHISWGIVTNKPSRFTEPLIADFPELQHNAVVICADQLQNSKPDPEGILLACKKLNIPPAQALYVGDHPKDIQAAKAAGAISIGVLWGYIPDDQPIADWQADMIIDHPDAILDLLD